MTTSPPLVQQSFNVFQWPDYVVFVLFLMISAGIGVYFSLAGGKQKTTKEYLTGNRSLALIPVAVSILVSFTSAILILGAPAELYLNGTMYLLYTFGKMFACLLAAIIFVPLFYPLKLTSSFEYLQYRFRSRAVRILGNFFYMLSGILYMGIAMYAPSAALSAVTGGAINVYVGIVLCGAVGTFYTFLGGIKAVIWTDVFQASIMLAGVFAIIIKGSIDVGGLGRVWDINYEYNRIEFDEFSFDPTVRHTFWGLVVGSSIGWLGTYGVNQASVQRYCSLPSLQKARMSLLINIPGGLILTWTAGLAGMVIFAYYHDIGCDIHGAGWAKSKNDIVPYFVMDQLSQYPTVAGLFISSLFSGALSSVSSSLNSLSAITWKDILQPLKAFKNTTEKRAAVISKILVAIYGVLGTGFAFVAIGLGGTVLQASLSFTGAVGGPSLGIFLLGALIPFANKYGAFSGALISLIINLWISIGSYAAGNQEVSRPGNTTYCDIPQTTVNPMTTMPPVVTPESALTKIYQISYLWYTMLSVIITILLGCLVSVITNCIVGREHVDYKYVLPVVRKFCCCCPRACHDALSCGIDLDARDKFEIDGVEEDEFETKEILNEELSLRPLSAKSNQIAPANDDLSKSKSSLKAGVSASSSEPEDKVNAPEDLVNQNQTEDSKDIVQDGEVVQNDNEGENVKSEVLV